MIESVNYFFNDLPGPASDNIKFYLDFSSGVETNARHVQSLSGDPIIAGMVLPVPAFTFWTDGSGSGHFMGQYMEITNSLNRVDTHDHTVSLVYECETTGGATLISTINTGFITTLDSYGDPVTHLQHQGYEFGVTANNRLYWEYYTDEGPSIHLSDFSLGDKNSVFFTVSQNNLTMGYYNFCENKLNTNDFFITTDSIGPTGLDMRFGWHYNASTGVGYANNKQFTGYLDQIQCFSPSVYPYELESLNSGYVYTFSTGTPSVTLVEITGVTGYLNALTGYLTQETGTLLIATGVNTNVWGVTFTGYYESGLSGTVAQYGLSGLTGVLSSSSTTGQVGTGLTLNTNYIDTFGKNAITFLSTIETGDFLELQLNPLSANLPQVKNLNLSYDNYQQNFYIPNSKIGTTNPIVFVNGLLQHSGSTLVTGAVYTSGQYIIEDYAKDGGQFLFSNEYNADDSVFIDSVGTYNNDVSETFSGPSSFGDPNQAFSDWADPPNPDLYFNGQKLISGLHYFEDENDVVFTWTMPVYDGVTGKLVKVQNTTTSRSTGEGLSLVKYTERFCFNFSQVYKNGVRQTQGSDYLELGALDPNSGSGFFDIKPNSLYNNDTLFDL